MTKKLYYYDSYVTEFDGNVIEVRPYDDKYAAVLSETYFYPESGGQPCDTGFIGETRVSDVEMIDDTICHIIDDPIGIGIYPCKIDRERRFDNMQQHTGQHILSAAFAELFDAMTDSFHIGENMCHIDIDRPGLSQADIDSAEERANEILYGNIPVTTYIVTPEEAAELPLRKHPSVDKDIRIVEVKNYDYSPCGGTHVNNTGEIGIIKIIKWEKAKNKLRIYFTCGKRAAIYFRDINHTINKLAYHFSANIADIPDHVALAEQEKKKLQKEISSLKNELALYVADDLYGKCTKLNTEANLVVNIFNEYDEELLRMVSAKLSQKPYSISVLGNISRQQRFIVSRSNDTDLNLKELFGDLSDHFESSGGGSPKQVQFAIKGDPDKIIAFIEGKIRGAVPIV